MILEARIGEYWKMQGEPPSSNPVDQQRRATYLNEINRAGQRSLRDYRVLGGTDADLDDPERLPESFKG